MSTLTVNLLIFFGSFFAIASLALLAVSLATDNWIEYTVDRDSLGGDYNDDYNAWSRRRGLFRTCYEGDTSQATFFDDPVTYGITVVDATCIQEEGFDLDSTDDDRNDWGSDYETRNHLLRLHVALFVISFLFIIIACVVSIIGCWRNYATYLYVAGGFMLAAGLFAFGGMGTFHGYWDLEMNDIFQMPFPAYFLTGVIEAVTDWEYGYSYYLGWVGAILAILSCIFFFLAGWLIRQDKEVVYVEEVIEKVPLPPQPIFVQQPEPPPPQVVVQQPPQTKTIIQRVPVPVPVIQEKPVPVPVEKLIPVPTGPRPTQPPAYQQVPVPMHMPPPPPMMQPDPVYMQMPPHIGMRPANSMPNLVGPVGPVGPMVTWEKIPKRGRPRHRHHHTHHIRHTHHHRHRRHHSRH